MLDDLAALGPFFAVAAHEPAVAPSAPWRPFRELTSPSGPLGDRVASVRAALAARGGQAVGDVESRVAASAVHLGLVARLVAPALGAAVLGLAVDMRLGGLWWQEQIGGPVPLSVPAAARDSAHDSADEALAPDPVAVEWDRLLLDGTVAPVTAAIARLVPVSSRVLWGNVASAANSAAAQTARRRPDLAARAWQAAGRLFASPWLGLEPGPPGPAFRRASCCLFYRLASGNPAVVCGDCVLRARFEYKALSRLLLYSIPRAACPIPEGHGAGPQRWATVERTRQRGVPSLAPKSARLMGICPTKTQYPSPGGQG